MKCSLVLSEVSLEALKRHALHQERLRSFWGKEWNTPGWVFCTKAGTPIDANNLRKHSFLPLLLRAGLPRIRFHDLRHSAATLFFSMGVHPKIVQELLGHSNISMTMNTYSHVLPTMQKEAMEKVNTFLQGQQ